MSDALFILATAYRTIYGVLGAYIAARLAPNRPMMHALILGALGTVAAAGGCNRDVGQDARDRAEMVCARAHRVGAAPGWLGAKLRLMQLGKSRVSHVES